MIDLKDLSIQVGPIDIAPMVLGLTTLESIKGGVKGSITIQDNINFYDTFIGQVDKSGEVSGSVKLDIIAIDNNSTDGTIEIIENEDLVQSLQKKYITHEFMKKIESVLLGKSGKFDDFIYRNLKYKSLNVDELGLPNDRTFEGNKTIPNNIQEMIKDLIFYRGFYLNRIMRRCEADKKLIEEINLEISPDK